MRSPKGKIGLVDDFGREVYCQMPKCQRDGQKKVIAIWCPIYKKEKNKKRNEITKGFVLITTDGHFPVLPATTTSMIKAFFLGPPLRISVKGTAMYTCAPLKIWPLCFTTLHGDVQPKNMQHLNDSTPHTGACV